MEGRRRGGGKQEVVEHKHEPGVGGRNEGSQGLGGRWGAVVEDEAREADHAVGFVVEHVLVLTALVVSASSVAMLAVLAHSGP